MIFRVRWKQLGGHVHMRVFAAAEAGKTFAKMGDLICRVEEFDQLRIAMAGCEFLPEVEL